MTLQVPSFQLKKNNLNFQLKLTGSVEKLQMSSPKARPESGGGGGGGAPPPAAGAAAAAEPLVISVISNF